MEVLQKKKNIETSILSAFVKMNTIQLYLAIGDEKTSKAHNHNEKVQVKTPSAKAEGFSQEVVFTTKRDPKLMVTPNCVTRASRVTSTQTVSSYSRRKFNK